MRKIHLFLAFIVVFSLVPTVYAEQGHIKLLAVKESEGDKYEGSVADLYLEIKPGSGRVFLETYPLAKIDTQISTRFAKEIACNYVDENCDKYDFFYTMSADSPIVGGPSAGASIAVLTISMIKGLDIDPNTAITGTINSGGLIGPVGGLSEKVEAASENNISKVLVSRGSRFVKKHNLTFDLKDYAEGINVDSIEVMDLNDAIFEFTGEQIKPETEEFSLDQEYVSIMKTLAEDLCGRAESLQEEYGYSEDTEKADNLTARGFSDMEKGSYYSGASYCFGANVGYREEYVEESKEDLFDEVSSWLEELEKKADSHEIKTIADLETYMIVKERIKDAKESANDALETYEDGDEFEGELAYAYERAYSAETWMNFFGKPGKEFIFNKEVLKRGCIDKISEADERLQYARIYFPSILESVKDELRSARRDFEEGNYELCLFKASKAKSEADSIITVIGVTEEDAEDVLQNRLNAVKRVMAEQEEGVFPILGYSYYEYALSLKEYDIFSALMYSSYALELSNLDMYFKEKDESLGIKVNYELLLLFVSGLLIGFVVGYGIKSMKTKKSKKKR